MPEKSEPVKKAAHESYDVLRDKLNDGGQVIMPRTQAFKFLRWLEGSTGTPESYTMTVTGINATFAKQ
jgi:hypothetical protein